VGGSWVFSTGENVRNHCHDAFYVREDVVVPKSEDAIAARFQIFCSLCVDGHLPILGMSGAVNLDDKSACVTTKIHKVAADSALPAKVRAFEAGFAKMPPQFSFCRRHHAAELARKRHARVATSCLISAAQHAPHPRPLPAIRKCEWGKGTHHLISFTVFALSASSCGGAGAQAAGARRDFVLDLCGAACPPPLTPLPHSQVRMGGGESITPLRSQFSLRIRHHAAELAGQAARAGLGVVFGPCGAACPPPLTPPRHSQVRMGGGESITPFLSPRRSCKASRPGRRCCRRPCRRRRRFRAA
jgi:hypothetical protein